MVPAEVDEYMNELLEKGAYQFEGFDPVTGEVMLTMVPEVMKLVDPALYEIYEIQAGMEFEQAAARLESLGLITRIDDGDDFILTEAAEEALAGE